MSSRRIELLTFGTGIRRATITPTALYFILFVKITYYIHLGYLMHALAKELTYVGFEPTPEDQCLKLAP